MTLFAEISNCLVNSVSTLLFLPLWCILIIFLNSLFPLINSKRLTFNLSLGNCSINLIFSIICLIFCIKNSSVNIENNILWLDSDVKIFLGTLVDRLSSVFLVFYSIVSAFWQVYFYQNLKDSKNFHRFYIYSNLMSFSVLGLILSSNLVQSLIFVLFISVVCYLFLTCFVNNKEAEFAARKVFLMNNFADIFLLVGVLIVVYFSSIFNVSQNLILLSYSNFIFHVDIFYSMFPEIKYATILLFMLVSVFMKLGQAPFFSSVLKISEGKSLYSFITLFGLSVSGVYLLARIFPMIVLSEYVLNVLVFVGIISAMGGIYFAMSQNILRKFLLCLAISQFGLILLSFGLKGYSVGVFAFISFIFAYILLFSVDFLINKNSTVNIKNIEGLKQDYPALAILFGIGALSICGLLFAGFYSQHFIFSLICETENSWLMLSYLFVVFLTTFALARVYFLVFEGNSSSEKIDYSIKLLILPLLFALISISFGAFLGNKFGNFIYFIMPNKVLPLLTVPFIIQIFTIVGAIYIAFILYVLQDKAFMKIKESILNKNNLIYKLSYECLYLDKICDFFQRILKQICNLFKILENFIDSLSSIVFVLINIFSVLIRKIQQMNTKSKIMSFWCCIVFIMLLAIIVHVFNVLQEV